MEHRRPSSQLERGRDSCLRAVFCYKRIFTKACIGCKRFFLKERENGMFLNKIDLPYCLVLFFVVVPLPRALAENVSKRLETRANNKEYNKAIRYKSILFKNITYFFSFKKNRLHPIQALRLVNIRL